MARRPWKDQEKKRRQLKCVNRQCRDGEILYPAFYIVCQYYGVKWKRGNMVCRTCFKKSMNYYKYGEKLIKQRKCVMESKFPHFPTHLVIESSSEDESELPSTSAPNLSTNEKSIDCLKFMVDYVLNKNKDVISRQFELCDDYIAKKVEFIQQDTDETKETLKNIEDTIKALENDIFSPYEANVTNESCVVINDDTVVNIVPASKADWKTVTVREKNKQEMVANNTDKDLISGDFSLCNVPADLPRGGTMVYPPLFEGHNVYAKIVNDPECWQKCKIKAVVGNGFIMVNWNMHFESMLHLRAIAYIEKNNPVQYHVGCRVISKYTNIQDNASKFYAGVVAESPTVLNLFRYMIFFDDGRVQYRHHKDIRLIVHKPQEVWNEVNSTDGSYKEFLQQYLKMYPERYMVKLINEHIVTVKSGRQWIPAEVVEVDASLVRLQFIESGEMEWLYRGSPRLLIIHEKLKGFRMRQSGLEHFNKPFVEFTTTQEEPIKEKIVEKKLESNSSVDLCSARNTVLKPLTTGSSEKPPINKKALMESNEVLTKVVKLRLPNDVLKPRKYLTHDCNYSCVGWTHYDYSKTKHINVLRIPLHFGFRRLVFRFESEDSDTENTSSTPRKEQTYIYYECPCGHRMRSLKEMLYYLVATKNKMTIEMFDFNSWVEPLNEFKVTQSAIVINDLSYGKEFRSIPCVNTISNKLPPSMKYITSRQPMPGVNVNTDPSFLCGCDCTDDCQDKSKCACWQLTIKNQKIIPIDADQYDPNIGYSYRRLPDRIITGIYECNSTCKCSKACLNRVVQQPLSHNLQLFMTEKKGWGVRCVNDIPSGSFICVYVGFLLTENDANQGGLNYGDEYLAELDYIEVVENTKEGYEKTVWLSDDENSNTMNSGDKGTVSETSDDDYQAPNERANKAVLPRLRGGSKRKVKKTKKNKKDSRQMVVLPPKHKARIISPKPPKSVRNYFGEEENVYIMDAKTSGNIGRYFNHSCSPNLFVQNVFVDTHDLRFPWISFFAIHFIPAGTELTWDYSYDIGSVPGKKMMCHCESLKCRKRLL